MSQQTYLYSADSGLCLLNNSTLTSALLDWTTMTILENGMFSGCTVIIQTSNPTVKLHSAINLPFTFVMSTDIVAIGISLLGYL